MKKSHVCTLFHAPFDAVGPEDISVHIASTALVQNRGWNRVLTSKQSLA
jgi:hypothetical protein